MILMVKQDYERALTTAKSEYGKLLKERERTDARLIELRDVILGLSKMCEGEASVARTDDCRSRSVQSAPSRQSESAPADNASLGRGGRYTLNVNALDDSPVLVSYDKHGFLVLTPLESRGIANR